MSQWYFEVRRIHNRIYQETSDYLLFDINRHGKLREIERTLELLMPRFK